MKHKKHLSLASIITRLCFLVALMVFGIVPFAYHMAKVFEQGAYTGIFIVTGILLALLIGVFVGYRSARQYAGPFEDLNSRAQSFAAGDHSIDFALKEGPKEAIEIADSLNAITKSTCTALSELRAEEKRQIQFVQDVSHEIRTPLTGIRGTAETLLDDEMPRDMQQRFLGMIISESDRLTRLANDLLSLQRLEAGAEDIELKRIDLHALIECIVDMLDPLFEERGVRISIAGEAPDILGDADKLTQVMVNLIENASRFAQDHVHIELTGLKGQSVITVSDNGNGFGDVDPARLFDRFYRADTSRHRASGGAGLGLAIVKTIVTAHDGTVEAFNIPSGGACFVVAIPSIAPIP